MNSTNTADAARRLGIYLQDHFAGANAGLALAHRSRQANDGTPLGRLLADIEGEISEDRRALESIMSRLGVRPSVVKSVAGSGAELVGRLKTNGRLVRRSPSSTVLELEALAAGVLTKRNLWRSLRTVCAEQAELDATDLDRLIERATSQLDRLLEAHSGASAQAFAAAAAPPPGRP